MPLPPPLPTSRPPVRELVEGLRVRRTRTVADRALAENIRQAFEQPEAPDVQGLHLYVFGGAVTIYGAVSTASDREAVLEILTGVPGATQIADHLTVLT